MGYTKPIILEDNITNGVVDKAPTENAVFDALALKANTSDDKFIDGTDPLDAVYMEGNVGIGTDSPDALLSVWRGTDEGLSGTGYRVAKFNSTTAVNADRPGIMLGYDTTGGGIIAPTTQAGTNNFLGFWTYNGGWGERLRISKDGNVGIGTTEPTYKLDVSGTGRFTGNVTALDFILSSDRRLKTSIEPLEIKELVIDYKEFEYKSKLGTKRYGVIAQELEEVAPELVHTDEQDMKSVSYIDLLVREIAYLKHEVAKLKNKA